MLFKISLLENEPKVCSSLVLGVTLKYNGVSYGIVFKDIPKFRVLTDDGQNSKWYYLKLMLDYLFNALC